MTFFSEREQGELPRNLEVIEESVWEGIDTLIDMRIADGSFGESFPAYCPDGDAVSGTDMGSFWTVVKTTHPNLEKCGLIDNKIPWKDNQTSSWGNDQKLRPQTLDVLDFIEFCWQHVSKPIKGMYHGYFSHYHLEFDQEVGRNEFRESVNTIFRRNGLVYDLDQKGHVQRLAPPILRESLATAEFQTGNPGLDELLEKARRKFLNPDILVRREALEALWDSWERLKTLDGADKKKMANAMLCAFAGSSSPKLHEKVQEEASSLTKIGNELQIRHSETDKEPVSKSEHVDYLFHRLFALISAILRSRSSDASS